jgi:hypothetical protein
MGDSKALRVAMSDFKEKTFHKSELRSVCEIDTEHRLYPELCRVAALYSDSPGYADTFHRLHAQILIDMGLSKTVDKLYPEHFQDLKIIH